ncbi:cobalamin B12-binding domain-containing protein [Piscibacillus sp. B03]|uniref:cobalamin B12-binding domain-containing protein n=1 Tax=Piscibacillus sp. B03 TaxID=3457430 RepID=UPI003FCDBE92
MKISEAVRLLEDKTISQENTNKSNNYETIAEQLYYELMNYNTSKANATIDFAFSLYRFEDVFHSILVPVLYRVGDEWENNQISVAQEHFASQLIMQRCTQFLRVLPVNEESPKAVALCPEGELHQIGLLLFSLFLRNKGMEVIYLGANTPLKGLDEIVYSNDVTLVAISFSHPKHKLLLEKCVDNLTAQHSDLEVIVGGRGADYLENRSTITNLNQKDWDEWYQSFIQNHK